MPTKRILDFPAMTDILDGDLIPVWNLALSRTDRISYVDLKTDLFGGLSADTEILFNNAGNIDGDSRLVYNLTLNRMAVGGPLGAGGHTLQLLNGEAIGSNSFAGSFLQFSGPVNLQANNSLTLRAGTTNNILIQHGGSNRIVINQFTSTYTPAAYVAASGAERTLNITADISGQTVTATYDGIFMDVTVGGRSAGAISLMRLQADSGDVINVSNTLITSGVDLKIANGRLLELGSKVDPDPAGTAGDMYFNLTSNKFRTHDGTSWENIGIGGSVADNQIAVGATITNNIEGSASLTYDGNQITFNIGDTGIISNVINNSDAVTGSAKFRASVSSASTGDSYLELGAGSVRAYAWGIDNSASDSMKLTTAATNTVTPSTGTTLLTVTGAGVVTLVNDIDISTHNIITDAVTGSQFGTASSQKIAVLGATPIIQQTTTSQTPATFVANSSGIADDTATWNGYTIGDLVAILQAFGFIA